MNDAREYASSIVFGGEMVMLGGYNDRDGWLGTVEKKTADGIWEEMESWELPRKMFNFCAATVDDTHIIIAGRS